MSSSPPVVLSFAASDPTGGAGVQADLLTIASLGCHPASVITALTVQDTSGVEQMLAIDPRWVTSQAQRLLADMRVAAFKLGVLGSAGNAEAVAETVSQNPTIPMVLDPVLASGRGEALADADTLQVVRDKLLPRTMLLTPNSLEARRLAWAPADAPLAACAASLTSLGCRFVLITGTHEPDAEVVNTLYDRNGVVREDRWPRLPGSYHGSGCTLASALATLLALGHDIETAVREAQDYTWNTLKAGFRPGAGQALPNRFFRRS
jgi:hydroxymethylpyrimidine/phosphomethylpyrimidine kinase